MGQGKQLNLIARRRRPYRAVRALANDIIANRELIQQSYAGKFGDVLIAAVPLMAAANAAFAEEAFALSRQWANK